MQFSIYKESRRGARKSNQDRVGYCHTQKALLMLVADGMGGHLRGELAARIAAQSITAAFRREARPRLSDPGSFLRRALIGAHHAILQQASDNALPEVPRTTCVACVVQDDAACWAHAGDSRLYHVRDGAILAQTRDHSVTQRLIDSRRLREESAAAHPERNVIYNCLGSVRLPQVELSNTAALNAGDTLLLCSDGLWSPLPVELIGGTLRAAGIMRAVPALLDEAERRAGRVCDNLSAIAMTWEQAAPDPARPRQPRAAESRQVYLSDDEIERAIARIRSAFKRQTND
jgi:serine/threonine protein phosphatase PrpC